MVMFEKRWPIVPAQFFSVDGGNDGKITISDTYGFKVKQIVILDSLTQSASLEVKAVESATVLYVGPVGGKITDRTDVSTFTTVDDANIRANEQPRSNVPQQEIPRITYAEEPTCAVRSVLVDAYGNEFSEHNPMPTNATFVGAVTVNIDALDPPTKPDPSNLLIVGSENGLASGLKHAARVDSSLDLRVGISDGTKKVTVTTDRELSVYDSKNATTLSSIKTNTDKLNVNLSTVATETTLSSINNKLNTLGQKHAAASVPVILADDQSAIPVNATIVGGGLSVDLDAFTTTPDNVMIVGSLDGTKTGTKKGLVYNIRQQILATHDRAQQISYADFGTKDQRITSIDYTSTTFPGVTARKTITYTLVGNKYRRDSITWTLI